MRAAIIPKYGRKHMKMDSVPLPTVGDLEDGQVLVRVHIAAINPADYKTRSGEVKAVHHSPTRDRPVTLGYDCAGVIVGLGPKLKQEWSVGDRVLCVATSGALAEYTCVYTDHMTKIDPALSFSSAAAIVTAGLTAYQMLNVAKSNVGRLDKVVITAGAGGVGHLAIQLAKNVFRVGTVVTTASGAKHDFVRQCGADVAVDYRQRGDQGDFVSVFGKGGCDAALDCTGESKACKRAVRTGGVVVGILGVPSGDHVAEVFHAFKMAPAPRPAIGLLNCIASCRRRSRVHVENIIMIPSSEELGQVARLCADGSIQPTIDRVYPLERAGEALDYVEAGRVVGKVLVEVVPGAADEVVQRNPVS
eukprot:CAMPEP_0175923424 /NCGR_PEP_ID=MMETSP0108-20121206/14565_1 /TAXON_ID=195067 ORGANISM="Goniomonas pacifica, Strain CCMP1869" /NCGR_SAMPLE_ID=MMETSP0108 /ASSEMBLY_ACC=CAM_ASM_000204 /LENGTH=360 /DNA_ID=CAMNT_0017246427 /DNA_START=11 /DNA_END=1093 /DNA_ORIENTATION=-